MNINGKTRRRLITNTLIKLFQKMMRNPRLTSQKLLRKIRLVGCKRSRDGYDAKQTFGSACLGPGKQVLEIINVSPNSDKTVGAISQN